jgi:hypothetical protein
MTYQFKTEPLSHQRKVFHETADKAAFAIFWEQGTGKTKLAIDTTAQLFLEGQIDGLLVVAPNGVHRNWVSDELPKHMPDAVLKRMRAVSYDNNKSQTQRHQTELEDTVKHPGLAVLCMSYDSLMSSSKASKNAKTKPRGKEWAKRFLIRRKVMYILDESEAIKTPKAKRTKTFLASAPYASFRRIMTGTPITNGPFDIYSQMKFLKTDFWVPHGISNFTSFKQHFGVWFTAEDCKRMHGYDPGYDQLVEYRNLDQLQKIIEPWSSRVLKEEVLDLPPKVYSKRRFDMNPEQKRVYEELKTEFFSELANGALIEAPLAIVRLLRFQQITCGYVAERDEPITLLGDNNPRLDLAVETAESIPDKAIIWARFTKDIDQLMDALPGKAVRYDGKVDDDEAERAKLDFQHGDAQWFVANPAKGKAGLTLHAAEAEMQCKTVMYYNNSFKLNDRLQSEDRAHRIGQKHSVNYIDLIASGTVDEHILSSLRNKLDIASKITGDQIKEWI